MNIPASFQDHKKRNLILWLTDMTLAVVSYFYVSNPAYIQSVISRIDFAALRPDLDPIVFTSPEFFELIQRMVNTVAILSITIIALIHTIAFYRCSLRKRGAIAYVKIYSIMAALSLVFWLAYNVSAKNALVLIPAAIYTLVFLVEKQPSAKSAP